MGGPLTKSLGFSRTQHKGFLDKFQIEVSNVKLTVQSVALSRFHDVSFSTFVRVEMHLQKLHKIFRLSVYQPSSWFADRRPTPFSTIVGVALIKATPTIVGEAFIFYV